MKINLVVTGPSGDKKEYGFDQDNVIIGSSVAANLKIEGEGIAGLHCMVRANADGAIAFLDMGSKTGVLLNGKKVREAPLGPGDTIELGDYRVGLSAAAAAPEPEEITEVEPEPAEAPAPAKPVAPAPAAVAKAAKPAKSAKKAAPKRKVAKKGPVGAVVPVVGASLAEDRPTVGNREASAVMRWSGAIYGEKSSLKVEKPVTLGSSPACNFIVPEEFCKAENFEFMTPMNGEWTVNVPEGWEFGYVDASGLVPSQKLEERKVLRKGGVPGAAWSFQLDNENACYFKSGPVQFDVRYSVPKQAHRQGFMKSLDKRFSLALLISAIFMVTIVSVTIIFFKDMMMLPPDDLNKQLNRFTKLIVKAPEKKKEDVPELKLKAVSLDSSKAPGKLEKFKANVKGPNIADPNKREQDRKVALKSGLLGALRGAGGNPAISSIFGAGGLGSGINNALTGLHGTMIGDSGGLGGLGSRGGGGGGGGGALGIGGIGTYGGGKSRRGYGDVNIGGGGKGETAISASKIVLVGGLEKEVIARIIQRHWAQIKYCYEKELTKNPNLYGKVVVQFTIGGTGKVDEAHIAQTEMNNEGVEGCITRNVKTWVFPQPKGGGVVYVTYPFIFKSAGQ